MVSELDPVLAPRGLAALSDTEIRDIILNGGSDMPMAAWKDILSSGEIDALLQFIKYTSP